MKAPILLTLASMLVTVSLSPAQTPAPAEQAKTPDYIQFVEDDQGGRLQTAIGHFASADGTTVDLIGAVHVADKTYYAELNNRFKNYDVVLYELVGKAIGTEVKNPAGAKAEAKEKKDKLKWLGVLQGLMRDKLKLDFQLECIDYHAANFVHADMDVKEFFTTQEEKGESFLALWWKAYVAMEELQSDPELARMQPGLIKIIELLIRGDSASELKMIVGQEFDAIEKLVEGIEAEGGTVIIGERNRVALGVMDREIKAGKKKLGIFYGAAHFVDMEKRLMERGFRKTGTTWITAWDMPAPKKEPAAAEKK
ncbi:MAG: hypothetical protein KDK97_21345 [Verrucomicrobiales bacterium]|nr:hypothetical protein [Verrucomicrobiales bacterium]MCP5558577.1 hypothetical protein [Verrucomicrobiaceae bacterium]